MLGTVVSRKVIVIHYNPRSELIFTSVKDKDTCVIVSGQS